MGLRLIPPAFALVLLGACGGAKASTLDAASASDAALVRGAWSCRMEGGAEHPGAVMEYNASYLSDGGANIAGVVRLRQDGKPLEINVVSNSRWSTGSRILRHEITYQGVTSAKLGEDLLDHGMLNKQFSDLTSADPLVSSNDAEILNITAAEMVLGEADGGITTCKRREA